jgi:sugar-specific transcriptional regulator TrmB
MIEDLKRLGLEHYEAKALCVLFKEKVSLRELSKKAEIPFGKVYSIVKNLKNQGLVLESNSRPKLIYVNNASEVIGKLIRGREKDEKDFLERVRGIGSNFDSERERDSEFFQIGLKKDERREIQLRTWREAEDEILQILNIHHNPKTNRLNKTIYEKEIENALKRGVVIKYIFPVGKELPVILKRLSVEYPDQFLVKRIDTTFPRCDIIDGKKVLVKLVHEDIVDSGGSIFVENEKLAENLVRIFNGIWGLD